MALTDILEKINQEAQSRIDLLNSEYEKRKKDLEKDNEEKIQKIDKDMASQLELQSAKIKESAEMEAEMEAKNQLLQAKRKVIDETLNTAIQKLSSADNYEDILVEMLRKADIGESVEVIPAQGKEEATRSAVSKSNKGFSISSESANISGGFILKSEKIEIDNSFETIIANQLRPNLEIELNKLMFS